jgi:hypothetical protein
VSVVHRPRLLTVTVVQRSKLLIVPVVRRPKLLTVPVVRRSRLLTMPAVRRPRLLTAWFASCPQTKVIDCLVCQLSTDQGYWLPGLPVVHRPRLLTARFASCPQTKVIDSQVCQLSADQGYITTTVLCLENHNNIIFRLILILLMNILQSKDLVNFLCITFQIRVYYVDLIYCFHKFLIILKNIIRYIIYFFLIYCFAYII